MMVRNTTPWHFLRFCDSLAMHFMYMNAGLRNLSIEVVPLASLTPYARNPHTHSAKQIRQIADSIRQFGFTNPILIDRDGGVVAGHGRIEAAKLLGMPEVPTVRLDQMDRGAKARLHHRRHQAGGK